MNRPRHDRLKIRGVVPIATLLALAAPGCKNEQAAFDTSGWAAERGNYDRESRRGAMVRGLAQAGIIPGAPRERVRTLLGVPDSTGPAADIYFLGRSATGPTFDIYRIDYGTDARVRAAAVQRH
jgi:hypothetical protein